ncbi:MAG: DUF4349 domain-containing protein [Defluviitaleaceae bacterium]|nr:DUF4349 domain-containing protein [Defluviitaleaceae bacterium]
MRLIIGFVLAAVCVLAVAVPVLASSPPQGRRLRQTHMIELEVECLETATAVIRDMNGYNLESSVFMVQQFGQGEFVRRANFTRRVDAWAFRHVQEVLRGLGEVTFETENAQHLGAQLMNTEIRLLAANQEIERLTLMMAASDTLNVLIAIDSRLSQVMWERDHLIGTRNLLLSQANSPVVTIWLTEAQEDRPVPVPPTFGSRVADSFLDSWNSLRSNAAGLLVFIVRVALPVVIWAAVLTVVGLVIFRVYKRKRVCKIALVASPPNYTDPEEDEENEK